MGFHLTNGMTFADILPSGGEFADLQHHERSKYWTSLHEWLEA
jgi:hypothetical protein